jgi:hypothetical protein
VTYPRGVADVLVGVRHEDASGSTGTPTGEDPYLAGSVERAMLFGRALQHSEIGRVYRAGPGSRRCAADCPDPTPRAPYACYSFEDNTTDGSGRGANATAAGGTTYGTGRVGRAIRLDGTSGHVVLPDLGALSDVTFAGWMNLHAAPQLFTRFIDGGRNSNTLFIMVRSGLRRTLGRLFNEGVQMEAGPGVPIAATAEWHHLALTYNRGGSGLRFYYDGALEGETPASVGGFDTWGGGQAYYIGRSNWCASCEPLLPALVDEVFVYDRALSSAEVAALYNDGAGVSCSDVVTP